MKYLTFPFTSLVAVVVSVHVHYFFFRYKSLPPPYENFQSQRLSASQLQRLPGGSLPPDRTLYENADTSWLSEVRRLFENEVHGVESVAVSPDDSSLLMLDREGYIHRAYPVDDDGDLLLPDGNSRRNTNLLHPAWANYTLNPPTKWSPMYIGPGRPLGYHVIDHGKHLLVCDSLKGLIKVDLTTGGGGGGGNAGGKIQILANTATTTTERSDDGSTSITRRTPIDYANDLDVGPRTDRVYFTSSTEGVVSWNDELHHYDTLRSYLLNYFRGDASGRLLRYDPRTHETDVILDGLFYANGVAVSQDESYVLVVETTGYRVVRVWLEDDKKKGGGGHKVGDVETFLERLPGAPDGITRSEDGKSYWVSIVAGVSPLHKLGRYPGLRQVLANWIIPHLSTLAPKLLKDTSVIQVDATTGKVMRVLVDMTSQTLKTISAVTEHRGALFFGSLSGDYVSVMDLDLKKTVEEEAES